MVNRAWKNLKPFLVAGAGSQRVCPSVYPRSHVEGYNAVRTENTDSFGNPLYEMDVYEHEVYENRFQGNQNVKKHLPR